MHLHAETWVSLPPEDVFPFFADAANLQQLTPPWLHFAISTPQPIAMRAGTLIEYRIRLHGIPLAWLTEIVAYDPPRVFVDRQLRGPYRRWIHTHQFQPERGGTLLLDHVEFDLLGGALVAPLIRRDLRHIFTHRHEALLARFAQPEPWPPARISFT
ncbi:MAG TPA: SRPBCC family protein [Vicinamibacterales bacterium]|nr:SRPBCC family protein [Vicinamibacterales bacterium]